MRSRQTVPHTALLAGCCCCCKRRPPRTFYRSSTQNNNTTILVVLLLLLLPSEKRDALTQSVLCMLHCHTPTSLRQHYSCAIITIGSRRHSRRQQNFSPSSSHVTIILGYNNNTDFGRTHLVHPRRTEFTYEGGHVSPASQQQKRHPPHPLLG